MVIGGAFGAVAARRVKMTAMPQMVALFNGVGGGAAALVALRRVPPRCARCPGDLQRDISISIVLSALIGSISFAGSMVAFAKLQELIGGRPITYAGQQIVNALLFAACRRARASRSSRAPSAAGCSAIVLVGALAVRHPLRAADRRRRHAGRDLAAERVHGPRRRGDRLRAREQRADRQRHARRRVGHAADADDGPGDEPLDRERPLRRVRPDPGRRRRRCAATNGTVRPTTADDVAVMLAYAQQGRRRARATAWRSRRRSTTCARSPTCSRARASR